MNPQNRRIVVLVLIIGVLVAAPLAVVASHRFSDVPDSNVHHDDIAWLADSGITFGCNPPENTEFCPGEPVLRQQMASFLRRLAENRVVDAATAVTSEEADHASDSDNLAGEPPISYQTVVKAANCGVTAAATLETSCLPDSGGEIPGGASVAVFNIELETEIAGTVQLSSTSLSIGENDATLAWAFTLNQECGFNAATHFNRAVNGQPWGTADSGFSTSAQTTTALPAGTHEIRLCALNGGGVDVVDLAAAGLTLTWTAGGSVEVLGNEPRSSIDAPGLLGN